MNARTQKEYNPTLTRLNTLVSVVNEQTRNLCNQFFFQTRLRTASQFLTTRTTVSATRDLPQDVSVHHPGSQVEQPADESWPYPEVAGANAVWRKCVRRVSYHIRENALFPVPRPTSQLTFSVAQLLSRLGQVCTAHSAQLRGDVRPELAQFGRLIAQPPVIWDRLVSRT